MAIGERIKQRREREEQEAVGESNIPGSVRGAFMDLREAVRETLRASPDAKGRVIDILDRAMQELKKQ